MLAVLVLLLWSPVAAAQIAESDATGLSETWLQQRIEAVTAATDLPESERERTVELYRQALEQYRQAQQYAETQRSYRRALTGAPSETERLRQELLDQQHEDIRLAPTQGQTLAELENRLSLKLAEQSTLRGRASELESQLNLQRTRPDQARAELTDTQRQLVELGGAPELERAETVSEHARAVLDNARILALTQRSAMLEQELLSHSERVALLSVQQDLINQQLTVIGQRIAELQQRINERRQQEAAEALRETEQITRALADRPEVLRRAAEINAELGQQLADVVQRTDAVASAGQQNIQQLQMLEERFHSIQQQLEIAGMSDALGPILRSERRQLPDLSQYQQDARERQQQIVDARLQQFRFEQQRRQLANLDEQIAQRLATVPDLTAEQSAELSAALRELLRSRRELLDRLSNSYASHINQLVELDRTQRRLIDNAERYGDLLDEKLFWIASSAPVGLHWPVALAGSLQWLLLPEHWLTVWQALGTVQLETLLLVVPGVLMALLLLGYRRHLLGRLQAMSSDVGKVQRDSFGLTLEALLITVCLALPWPLLVGVMGWRLEFDEGLTDFVRGVGSGLFATAAFWLVTNLLRQLCRPGGIAPLHFRWSEQTCRVIRRSLHWFMPIGGAAVFVVQMTEWHPEELYRDTLGRLAFVVGTLAFALLLSRVFHPHKGTLRGLLSEHGLAWRLRFLWYPLVVGLPLAMLILALFGYYYTALQLQGRLVMTVCVLIAVAVATYLILRPLNVTQRRLALARALARREALQAARSREGGGVGDTLQAVQEAEAIDIEAVGEQTRALLQLGATLAIGMGLWLIWADLLPALTFLDQVVLWEQVVSTELGEQVNAITLGSLVVALVLLVLLLFVARNLPGLLEITILRRLGMDGGTRYAITSITQYTITIIALFVTLNILGVSWSQAQWLVAALGVGLGFGLQEIFANFVSGLILLLERPIRVGDTVTIDGRSGTVSRIRIRATTLTDWDNMEIVIPNKTFITGTLINWTLTDPVTRVIIPVRVGFDADLERVHDILLETTKAHQLVLADPEPLVFLLHLGESSVTFEVRAFVRDIADRLPIINDLYMRIIGTLREQAIQVPFPQRDLHIRSIPVNHPGAVGVIAPSEPASSPGGA